MRIFTAVLAAIFILGQMDASAAFVQTKAKRCCCGSKICRCAGGEGKHCPLRNPKNVQADKASRSENQTGKSCHLSKETRVSAGNQTGVSLPLASGRTVFQASRCGTNGEKASLPSHAKDFVWIDLNTFQQPSFYEPRFLISVPPHPASWLAAIDHPPRIL